MKEVDVAIIGAGTSGLNAMAQVRRVGKSFVLINGGNYGTTCARVGCMPSKAFIQVGDDFHRRRLYARFGIEGGKGLQVDAATTLEYVRGLRDHFVERVTSNSTDGLGAEKIDGYAEFLKPDVLQVGQQRIHAGRIVIATGSSPVIPPHWEALRDRILTTDDIFELEDLPASMAVIGLGVIGLELGQALHHLGVKITGIDRLTTIGGLSDPAVNRAAVEILGKDMPLWLGVDTQLDRVETGLRVNAGERSLDVEKILVSVGRRPNLEALRLDRLGVQLDARGLPAYDPHTMQLKGLPIFMAGDVNGDRAVLHEAGDEGRIAGYNAACDVPVAFKRKTPMSITFSDPNIAQVGTPWAELEGRADEIAVGEINFASQGRALIMGANRGLLRVYAEKTSGRLLGGAMLAPRGENLAHLLAWSIELGLGARDLARMPYYHPVIEEALQSAVSQLLNHMAPTAHKIPPELQALQ